LKNNLSQLEDIEQWGEILKHKIDPSLLHFKQLLLEGELATQENQAFFEFYEPKVNVLLAAITAWLTNAGAERNERLRACLVEAAPALRPIKNLAQCAYTIYRALPEIDVILFGMRSERYVQSLTNLELPHLTPEEARAALEKSKTFLIDYEDEVAPAQKT